jgi:hypothetical protein
MALDDFISEMSGISVEEASPRFTELEQTLGLVTLVGLDDIAEMVASTGEVSFNQMH